MERLGTLNPAEKLAQTSAVELTAEETASFLVCTATERPASIPMELRRATPWEVADRLLDIALASALILLVLPLLALCVVAVLSSGPGPVLFRQPRLGRGGFQFTCLKFRTMACDAESAIEGVLVSSAVSQEEWASLRKLKSDPRVTRVGKVLRRYCLDELPQLFNVLGGDMSIVGPRPIVAQEIVKYGPQFEDYCSVKPGLTGLWQVSGRHALSYDERVRLDSAYARSKSLGGDLLILWKTVPIVLLGLNE